MNNVAINRNDSPTPRKPAAQFSILEESAFNDLPLASSSGSSSRSTRSQVKHNNHAAHHGSPLPLTTSKMVNQQSPVRNAGLKSLEAQFHSLYSKKEQYLPYEKPLPHLIQPVYQYEKPLTFNMHSDVDAKEDIRFGSPVDSSTASNLVESADLIKTSESELFRLKMELEAAKDELARKDQELVQQRITQTSINQVLGSPSEAGYTHDITDQVMNRMMANQSRNPFPDNQGDFMFPDRSSSMTPGPLPWADEYRPDAFPMAHNPLGGHPSNAGWNQTVTPPWAGNDGRGGPTMPSTRLPAASQMSRQFNPRPDMYENNPQYMSGMMGPPFEHPYWRTNLSTSRPESGAGQPLYNSFRSFAMTPSPGFSPPMTPMSFQHMQQGSAPYQPRPIGTPLSPTALEFSAAAMSSNGPPIGNPWNTQATSDSTSTYVPPMEPMNYRRLLDRNMSCNWKYVVDKIVCSNDQQASIFLQQKLKVATPEQKYDLVEAIISQAYPLMINRFGNFLVQRCFEHGTPDQIVAIANAIRGNTLNLSMDAFGCHVVQKAFDVVPEEYKAMFVHELLRRIPETVIHRYACHVWQKLFELRWSDSPPQIMKYVNEALRGMWHEVALGETGSLVVQNIFENCLEEDKRPCINEVLASIDIVAHGQFGNWCIQHICEHGAPADKSRATEHVLRYATEYSTDQFASKVVEKCLKVGSADFLERYLDRVCEGRADRPRMPLIDIAGDQYGNYLVQYILIHANPQHREVVANHIRKHMVSLRGSKFGSRVAMLCCNPASATRPGPPVGIQMNNRFMQNNMGMPYGRPALPGTYH